MFNVVVDEDLINATMTKMKVLRNIGSFTLRRWNSPFKMWMKMSSLDRHEIVFHDISGALLK